MNNKYKKSKLFVSLLSGFVVLIGLLGITYSSFFLSSVANGISMVDNVVSRPFLALQNLTSSVHDLAKTYQENQTLKSELYDLKEMKNELSSLEEENNQLRQQLDLKGTLLSDFKVSANVINRSPLAWLDSLMIGIGASASVKEDMLVVANGGLIGAIYQVNQNSSIVHLLTNEKNTSEITVKIQSETGDVFGVLEGYSKQEEAFIIRQLNNNAIEIKEGAQVSTSGFGDYPVANIPVGTVLSVSEEGGNLSREVYVKPAADFSSIQVVTVVGKGHD